MSEPTETRTFHYTAQTMDGQPLAGSVEALDLDDAQRQLTALGLSMVMLDADAKPPRARPLRGEDFAAFNQQLAHLTQSGLPIERGLRLIAQDMRSGRLAATVRQIAAELEQGKPLGEAFAAHRGRFPALYGQLLDAGVKSNNLPGMLLNLGRHLDLLQRMRAALWRALAYPAMVLLAALAVIAFICLTVLPHFREIFAEFDTRLPLMTEGLLLIGNWIPVGVAVVAVLIVLWVVFLRLLQRRGRSAFLADTFALPLPLIGGVLRKNLVARWCDAVRLGVDAGLDLPQAIELAGRSMHSPSLTEDGARLNESLNAGRPLDEVVGFTVLPPAVPAAMQLAHDQRMLSSTLDTMTRMYQQQAEMRLGTVEVALGPITVIGLGLVVGLIVAALFLPLVMLMRSLGLSP